MNVAITGVGPRTGTGFVMEKCHEAGLPVFWNEDIDIDGSSYDAMPDDLVGLRDSVVKVWPGAFHLLPIERMVVIRRNRKDQLRSIRQQKARERKQGYHDPVAPQDLLGKVEYIMQVSDLPENVLEVKTEDLDERIDEIIEFVRGTD